MLVQSMHDPERCKAWEPCIADQTCGLSGHVHQLCGVRMRLQLCETGTCISVPVSALAMPRHMPTQRINKVSHARASPT